MKNSKAWCVDNKIYLLNKSNYVNIQVFDLKSQTWSVEKLPYFVSSIEYKNLLKVIN